MATAAGSTQPLKPIALDNVYALLDQRKKDLNKEAANADYTLSGGAETMDSRKYSKMKRSWILVWNKVEDVLRASTTKDVRWLCGRITNAEFLVSRIYKELERVGVMQCVLPENVCIVNPAPVSAVQLTKMWDGLRLL
jgi:hypothetical protein